MTSDSATLTQCLAGYARRLHAAFGDQHHVASPLGAWLLLALCGPAAVGADRTTLTDVLGCDVDTAARLAAGLLTEPHPLIASAAALWTAPGAPLPARFEGWRAGLPPAVQTGDLPGQAELDAWARDHTFGLIDRFPIEITLDVFLVLATALATRVSWARPFDLASAKLLGTRTSFAGLRTVLHTPEPAPGRAHRQFIAITPEVGDVAVHLARARGGLLVASVAAAAEVPYGDVLAVAQRIGTACAAAAGDDDGVPRRRLADLPLGDAPLWRVWEETARGTGAADVCTAVLPAWTARSNLTLTDPELGFAAAVRALADDDADWTAAQAAMARYSRTGFEAAAVTAVAVALSMVSGGPVRRRAAELRFAHPYAVVAIATDDDHGRLPEPWLGVPVFSAWMTEPEDATDEECR